MIGWQDTRMCLKIVLLFCTLVPLSTSSSPEESENKPIIDVQYAEPHILGAASRGHRHPGPYSLTVYYPSIAVLRNNYDGILNKPTDDTNENRDIDNNSPSEGPKPKAHLPYGYFSGYSMVSTGKTS